MEILKVKLFSISPTYRASFGFLLVIIILGGIVTGAIMLSHFDIPLVYGEAVAGFLLLNLLMTTLQGKHLFILNVIYITILVAFFIFGIFIEGAKIM